GHHRLIKDKTFSVPRYLLAGCSYDSMLHPLRKRPSRRHSERLNQLPHRSPPDNQCPHQLFQLIPSPAKLHTTSSSIFSMRESHGSNDPHPRTPSYTSFRAYTPRNG